MNAGNIIESAIILVIFIGILAAAGLLDKYIDVLKEKYKHDATPDQFEVSDVIRSIVYAAEERFKAVPKSGEKKLDFVYNLVTKRFPDLDTRLLEAYIQAEVKRMNDKPQPAPTQEMVVLG
jgi:hypothetical protein